MTNSNDIDEEHEHEDFEKFIRTVPDFKQSRLSSLYSNFEHNKTLNQIGYEANINAWKSLLIKLTTSKSILPKSIISLDTTGLNDFLTIPIYGYPQNLGNILNELIHTKVFIPNSVYQSSKGSYFDIMNNNSGNLILDYLSVKSWVKWSVDAIIGQNYSIVNKNGSLKNDRLIYWNLLVKYGDEVLNYITQDIIKKEGNTYSSKLFSNLSLLEKLIHKFPYLTSIDFGILLLYWSRDKSACSIKKLKDSEIVYIKFDSGLELTTDDIGIINIQLTLSQLNNRINQLETRISQINPKTVLDLPSKSDQLRKLKQLKLQKLSLVKSLETSNKLWDELNTILIKINDSNLNHEVYQQLVSSSRILKNLNDKVSLEDIDYVKLDIDEAIAQEDEISQALGVGHGVEEYDDDEIETELQNMTNEMKKQETTKEKQSKEGIQEQNEIDKDLLTKLDNLKVSDIEDNSKRQEESKQLVPN